MIIMSGPKVGTVSRWLSATRTPKPMPTPTRAVRIGRPMATTDPKASSMTTTAASSPIISLDPGAAETTCSTGAPPTATCRPGRAKLRAVSITRQTAPAGRSAAAASNWTTTKPIRRSARQLPAGAGAERAVHAGDVCQGLQGAHQPADGRGVGRGCRAAPGERRTTSALSPFWDGNRLASRFWACCEGELPRAKLLSSRLPAHCASPMTATTASEPAGQHPAPVVVAPRGEPAEPTLAQAGQRSHRSHRSCSGCSSSAHLRCVALSIRE